MNDRRIGREEVIEKFGVPPEQVGEVLALMGDSVDNVPGVPGIGPKTASKLIQEFGDVEAVLAAAPEMKPSKMRDNLIEHADKARLSRKLVELICDSPLPEPLDALAMKGIPEEPLREFLDHHGFRSLLARLGVAGAGRRAPPRAGADPGRGPARAEDRPLALRDGDRRGGARPLDRRGERATASSPSTPRPTGATASRPSWSGSASPPTATRPATSRSSMAATTCSPSGPSSCPSALVLAKLKPLLEDPAILKIGHNLKFDWVVLDRRGIRVAPYDDTLVMSFNLDAGGLNSPFARRSGEEASRPRLHRLQGAVRDRAEADHLQPRPARQGDRICRRGCRRDAAALAALPGAAAVREGDAGLRAGRPADGRGGRRGWSATGSRSTARC